ncbi:hypothetical protein [Aquabacterium sp.]|uniref:hypothetical protein n=1 Tax=Aquabacterium sp. TaxID=1872578 RepID=UPI0037849EC2
MLMSLLRGLGRLVRGVFTGLLALLILFEEWGWEPLQRAMAWVGQLPVLRHVEALIRRLPPRLALLVFLLPSLLLLPVKLLALWLVAHGQKLLGLGVIVLAKVGGTAVVARLFALTKPALMRMGWFARGYDRWTVWKEALLARVRASFAWRWARAFKRQVKRRWARWRAAFG